MAILAEESRRLILQSKLEELLGSDRVYYQPPESITLKYPCILYTPDPFYSRKADNTSYITYNRYHVQHIYKQINGSLYSDIMSTFKHVSHDQRHIVDSLYHDEYTIYI